MNKPYFEKNKLLIKTYFDIIRLELYDWPSQDDHHSHNMVISIFFKCAKALLIMHYESAYNAINT